MCQVSNSAIDVLMRFLLSFRTCQGGSGPGADAGADHSDGVSEQNEGTSELHSVVEMH